MTTAPVSITLGHDLSVRYAAYLRWSDNEQKHGYTYEAQLKAIQEYVAARGGTLVKIYVDEGKSGTKTKGRTQLAALLRDAPLGGFDAVVAHKADRLGRHMLDALKQIDLLENTYHIQVRLVEGDVDPTSPYASLIRATVFGFAETFSKNLGTEVTKGQKEMFAAGRHVGGVPFGYTLDNPGTRSSRLVPGTEAPLVRQAFQMYASGEYSMRDIVIALNGALEAMGVAGDE